MSGVEVPPTVPSEDIVRYKADACLSNALVKTGLSFSAGVLASVVMFKRRAWPVWVGTGFGVGQSWTECERSFNPTALPGVRVVPTVPIVATPEGTTPGAAPLAEPAVDAAFPTVSQATSTGAEKLAAGAEKVEGAAKDAAKEAQDAAAKASSYAKDSANDLLARAQKNTQPAKEGKHLV